MSKKQIALVIGGITPVLFGLVGMVYFVTKVQNPNAVTNSQAKALDTTGENPISDQTYTDSSGFSFKYPKDVTVKDTTPDDEIYYSQVNLEHKGNIVTIDRAAESDKVRLAKWSAERKLLWELPAGKINGTIAKP